MSKSIGVELRVGTPSDSVIKTALKLVNEHGNRSRQTVAGLRNYLEEFGRLNGGLHQVFVEDGFYIGAFTMAGIIPEMFKTVCQRYFTIDACVNFFDGKDSGHSFIGEMETATHLILPGALGLGYGETNDCWQRFLSNTLQGFHDVSPECAEYFNHPSTIVAGGRDL
mmetsp:Transcript_16549/g.30967  ORF Transcript_16549/g.30967 Transcript_16549/m.30967 type:complete len:167 (-) Transcript_16549:50-550(-)